MNLNPDRIVGKKLFKIFRDYLGQIFGINNKNINN